MAERRVAVVTGGAGGLGTAICQGLAHDGFDVAPTCTPGNPGVDAWLATQRDSGFTFTTYRIDVGDFTSCEAGIREILAAHGRIDVLVNNAGITRDRTVRKMTPELWREVLRTNLDSVFNMSRHVIDGMAERRWGRIINISSIIGQQGGFGQANYAAAKAGMHGFTKSLALELASSGITVNTVSPGFLRTKMVTGVPPDILQGKILPRIPLGRLGEPAEVANMVSYLASDAAAFVSGANLTINGGQHLF